MTNRAAHAAYMREWRKRHRRSVRRAIQDSCVLWPGAPGSNGYGRIWRDGKQWPAPRWVWTQAYGPIPAGLVVMHLCDVPMCVSLDHLVLGTRRANMLDRNAKGRDAYGPNRPSARELAGTA